MDARTILIELAYLVAAVCFIIGLRRLSSPATARSGNQVAAVGMIIAILATFANSSIGSLGTLGYVLIVVGALIGGGIGFYLARTVQMTAMPQMVALFNGMGGGAAAFSSTAEFLNLVSAGGSIPIDTSITTVLGVIIGSISMSGSVIALGKLQGFVSASPITYQAQQIVNALIGAIVILLGLSVIITAPSAYAGVGLLAMIVGALVLGVAIVLPIGGADMPVVISLLNSFTGLAAAFTGFVLHSNVLIISGALVGASGTLLTLLMARA